MYITICLFIIKKINTYKKMDKRMDNVKKMDNVEGILAMDEKFGLAKNGKIPWKNKEDLAFFKNKTINNIVVMGINTLLSLPKKEPLKDRHNIVITGDTDKYSKLYQFKNIEFVNATNVVNLLNGFPDKTIFIIGGNQVYNLLLPYCSVIWLTEIKGDYDCDLLFTYDVSLYNKTQIYRDDNIQVFKLFF
jgi:dihydrofolate reductase